ncbi:MAG: hypothetical protein ACREC6_01480, partial [Hyphomicrobiaceae bacterium]
CGTLLASLILMTAASGAAEDRVGRFTMNPTEGGMLRLDTQTGAVSLCRRKDDRWVCEAVGEEGGTVRGEIERLTAENKELKAENKRLEALVPEAARKKSDRRLFDLPSEEDIDRALGYIERWYRKFRDKLKDLQGTDRKDI